MYFSAFDRRDGSLSVEEQEEKALAKRKMLGNIKFIGMIFLYVIIYFQFCGQFFYFIDVHIFHSLMYGFHY